MKLTIEIKTDNAAFEELEEIYTSPSTTQVFELLRPFHIEAGEDGKIYDVNGNHVGYWEWK